jgi:hypothetical protein
MVEVTEMVPGEVALLSHYCVGRSMALVDPMFSLEMT